VEPELYYDNQAVTITGSGSGVGRQEAKMFASRGIKVVNSVNSKEIFPTFTFPAIPSHQLPQSNKTNIVNSVSIYQFHYK
jgi:hypothetical protein